MTGPLHPRATCRLRARSERARTPWGNPCPASSKPSRGGPRGPAGGRRHDRDRAAADRQPAEPRPRRGQGFPAVQHPADHRPQDHRPDVPGGVVRVLHRRRPDGHAHAGELARPGLQFLSPEQYNQLFTMHGTVMLLMFATPLFFAFGNLVMPLQIGAPDVAFPRLNALSFWLFLFGSTIAMSGFLTPGGASRLRLVRLRAAVQRRELPGRRREPVVRRPGRQRPGHDPRRRSTSSPRSSACAHRA